MKKTMAIVTNYTEKEGSYGLLGPQMAATIINDYTDYECLVVAIGHDFDKELTKNTIIQLVDNNWPVIGFSHLGERPELWELARELKKEGAVTILGGPQADVNYLGEVGWQKHAHRFPGLQESFTFGLQGPAEQIIPFLNSHGKEELHKIPGLLFKQSDRNQINPRDNWKEDSLNKVDWGNLYRMGSVGLEPLKISNAQVVQQIGCPYAASIKKVSLDYPTNLNNEPFSKRGKIYVSLRGCSFCDVAVDKGLGVKLSLDAVLDQILLLPEGMDGRKIPFELINENPFPTLPQLLLNIKKKEIMISQINLVTRADWLVKREDKIRETLELTKSMEVRILLSGVGFESFANSILRNLNKGYTVDTNLATIKLMRQLKEEFPSNFLYSQSDGAVHGFIHPTPWDSPDTKREMYRIIFAHGLEQDILPSNSVPLIIHHASWLSDWIRELEEREGIRLGRAGSLIEWW